MSVRIGIAGLGRLGRVHAQNLLTSVPGCDLIAVCSVIEDELQFARETLHISHTFSTYEQMVQSNLIDAVFIVTPSGLHCQHIELAMNHGKHVFCEKPMGIDLESIQSAQAVIASHPSLVFMLGFMRRYDESYQYAKAMVDRGEIGEITLMRCYGIDPASSLSSFIEFARRNFSGGLFLDMAIHDIDIIRWFTGQEISQVWAIGKNNLYPELDALRELETGSVMMQLENHSMALIVAGRNALHGYHIETEIMGTKGMIRVAQTPDKNLVTVMNEHGVIRPCSQHFSERFHDAFIQEAREFIRCIQASERPQVTAKDGLQATAVALACQQSYEENRLINIQL
ncbi:inositol 2-dehydrogenase (plasmid) [Entomospira entomophila]|uniref:Inositol 2-dehydrogenase n=1 Tax=Entomospira entomophila TaxID=2719988 RepID=A0A968G9X8_9SPIO|nr:inositol 2-dehydrogenase [Entomospira entomophilus]NIZ41285.1 inositol 2-dehydrogenase [Entomospira entomophilus]WDI36188.1 inositol 2-dehydrogenase [Entomospira entomophilus]